LAGQGCELIKPPQKMETDPSNYFP